MRTSLRASIVLALLLPTFTLFGETVQVRIRFLNGHNGKAIANKSVVLIDLSDRRSLGIKKTDRDGYVVVSVDRSARIRANIEKDFLQNCDGVKDAEYSVEKIISSGIADANDCGHALSAAKPGELIRFVRRSNFVESLREN